MRHLTDTQAEILGLLEEECAEVIQAIKKADRFGLSSVYEGISNRRALHQEIGDVVALVFLLTKLHPDILSTEVLEDAMKRKLVKLKKHCQQLKDIDVENLLGE